MRRISRLWKSSINNGPSGNRGANTQVALGGRRKARGYDKEAKVEDAAVV